MKKCPICGAKHKGAAVCHRCGSDRSDLLELEARFQDHWEKARAALEAGDGPELWLHARRCAALCQSEPTRRLLACAALLDRRFDRALALWSCERPEATDRDPD